MNKVGSLCIESTKKPNAQRHVGRIPSVLARLFNEVEIFNRSMEEIDGLIKANPSVGLMPHYKAVCDTVNRLIGEMRRVEESAVGFKEIICNSRVLLRQLTGYWFYQSPLFAHTFYKPQGYPGDFLLMEKIYKNKPAGEGVGYLLDKQYLDSEGSCAIRSRREKISQMAVEHAQRLSRPVSIVDIGCGPCRVDENIISALGPDKFAEVLLVDQDKDALAFGKKVLSPWIDSHNVKFLERDLMRLLAGADLLKKNTFDIILCTGVYDYLYDETFAKFLRYTWKMLKPQGTAIIAHCSPAYLNRTEREWVMDWVVHHRSEDEIKKIIEDADVGEARVNFTTDKTGTIVIFKIEK